MVATNGKTQSQGGWHFWFEFWLLLGQFPFDNDKARQLKKLVVDREEDIPKLPCIGYVHANSLTSISQNSIARWLAFLV
jgi:hypothetical protein